MEMFLFARGAGACIAFRSCCVLALGLLAVVASAPAGDSTAGERHYSNRLVRLAAPKPLLADYPQWVEPIRETNLFEAPLLVDDPNPDLYLRSWRFSYNARGIVEMPNRLRALHTAVIMVHPW